MNCANVRSRILAKTHPEKLPAVYKQHVHACPACQAWHRQLLAVEQVATLATIPDSSARKARFIQQFLVADIIVPSPTAAEPPTETAPAPVKTATPVAKPAKAKSTPKGPKTPTKSVLPAPPKQPLSERLTQLWPVGVAAVVVLAGAVLWSLRGTGPQPNELAAAPPDPFLTRSVLMKVKLDTATNPSERMKVWLNYADDIHDEAKTLAKVAPGADMETLAKLFDQVVRDAMVKIALSLDVTQSRPLLLECVDRLGKVEQAANRLSIEAPNGSSKPLLDIAAAAKEGKERIAQLTLGKAI